MTIKSSPLRRATFYIEVLLLAVGALALTLPFIWMLLTSLKSSQEVFAIPPVWFPERPQWTNYLDGLTRFAFGTYFANSFLVSSIVTATNLAIASLAAFALTQFRFRGRHVIFLAILSTMMLPAEVVLIPQFLIVDGLGWLNSYAGLIVPNILDAFSVFLMHQFMKDFPKELVDAARVDGAGELTIFVRIVLPNVMPALAAIAVWSFRESWDLFIWPLVIISRDHLKTFPLGIAQFNSEALGAYEELMAVALVGVIPMVILFILFRKAFIRSIALTGMKG